MDPMGGTDKFKVRLIASFLGLKFLPSPLILGFNNFSPKLVLSDKEVEYRAFILTNHISYDEIEKVDIFLWHQTTNVNIKRKNSVFTFGGNTNDENELYKCLKYLKEKGCMLTDKAEKFYLKF
jgi:hypothetical protein